MDAYLNSDLSPLRKVAEEMAREMWDPPSEMEVARCKALLRDLTIDATRDRWVRWGIERDTAAYEAEADVKWARVVAGGYSEDVMAVLSEGWERAKAADRRVLHEQWYSLRDNPEALRAAILAALETK